MKFVIDNIFLVAIALVSGAMLLWPLLRRGAGGPSVSTLEATQMVAHMIFFLASACCAIGTHCALENTPRIRSTFSCSISRVISLIATSVLDCASA